MSSAGQLARAYRAEQLAIRARSLKRVTQLWPMLDITALPDTVGGFAVAAASIVIGGWDGAALDTALFLEDDRAARGVRGSMRFTPSRAPSRSTVAGLIRGAALSGIINGRKSGMNATKAMANGLTKTLGQAGRTVLDGGRETIVEGSRADRQAGGWERDISPGACDFCSMLAARGPAYTSESAATFEAHDHCGCTGRLAYAPSERSAKLAAEWQEVTSGLSGAAARAAWRQFVGDTR